MPKTLLNTLYVQSQGAYLHLESDTIKVEVEGELKARVPLHHIGGIVVFGNVLLSPFLIGKLSTEGKSVTWLANSGRFQAQAHGPQSGNILLRQAQFEAGRQPHLCAELTRRILAGKLQNARSTLLRAARESNSTTDQTALRASAEAHATAIRKLPNTNTVDELRGLEGEAAAQYFRVFTHMIRVQREEFYFHARIKRPPRDAINALLSFIYALLTTDCVAALQSVGLDPQLGFLHVVRPGRPSLALDLLEEYRSPIGDRLALTLVNRQQIQPKHFEAREGGAVMLNEDGRKIVLVAYQERKKETLIHPFTGHVTPVQLIPHVQARLLAKTLRGDLETYPPFILRG
jgi:CRISP-associated protein Cas1